MAVDVKYGKVTLENDPGLEEDEVVVVFRARDKQLLELLDYYHDICHRDGAEKGFLNVTKKEIIAVRRWQQDNVYLVELPDHLNLPD